MTIITSDPSQMLKGREASFTRCSALSDPSAPGRQKLRETLCGYFPVYAKTEIKTDFMRVTGLAEDSCLSCTLHRCRSPSPSKQR